MSAQRSKVVVIGGGIAGLTTAYRLAEDPAYDVTVLEASPEVGGKLRVDEVAGIRIDVGAESILNRRPEGVALARELGLPVVHPATISAQLWSNGEMRPMPRTIMGIPIDVDDLARSGVLTARGIARVREEPTTPPLDLGDDDVSVGHLVTQKLGEEVVDRLVEPLLGGVYAGHARELSARAAVPQVVSLLDQDTSLLRAAANAPAADPSVPVFAGVEGGVGRLPQALVASGRFEVRRNATVRELRVVEAGFELVVGPTTAPELIRDDQVVVATPAAPAARLLADIASVASAELAELEYASMAIVTMAFRAEDLVSTSSIGSGFLVPPVDGHTIKASTLSYAKWDWVRESGNGLLLLRASIGRHREEAELQRTDDELVAIARAELGEAIGLSAEPVDSHVQRWGGGLPQYAVGHLERVARIRADVARVPGLAICGAAYDGLGIPAVIASAHRAVAELRTAE